MQPERREKSTAEDWQLSPLEGTERDRLLRFFSEYFARLAWSDFKSAVPDFSKAVSKPLLMPKRF